MKVQKEQTKAMLPLSDWDIFPWSKEMYQKHEVDFQTILKEYRELKVINGDNAIMARKVWMERKGGTIMTEGSKGVQETLHREKYQHFSNMFDRFSDWLSQKEKREMTDEQMKAKRNELKNGLKKVDFSIPQEVRDGAERDIQHEEMKNEVDEVTQHALDHF